MKLRQQDLQAVIRTHYSHKFKNHNLELSVIPSTTPGRVNLVCHDVTRNRRRSTFVDMETEIDPLPEVNDVVYLLQAKTDQLLLTMLEDRKAVGPRLDGFLKLWEALVS